MPQPKDALRALLGERADETPEFFRILAETPAPRSFGDIRAAAAEAAFGPPPLSFDERAEEAMPWIEGAWIDHRPEMFREGEPPGIFFPDEAPPPPLYDVDNPLVERARFINAAVRRTESPDVAAAGRAKLRELYEAAAGMSDAAERAQTRRVIAAVNRFAAQRDQHERGGMSPQEVTAFTRRELPGEPEDQALIDLADALAAMRPDPPGGYYGR